MRLHTEHRTKHGNPSHLHSIVSWVHTLLGQRTKNNSQLCQLSTTVNMCQLSSILSLTASTAPLYIKVTATGLLSPLDLFRKREGRNSPELGNIKHACYRFPFCSDGSPFRHLRKQVDGVDQPGHTAVLNSRICL